MQTPSEKTATEELAVRAATLSRNASLEWQAFIKALAVYNEVHRENLIRSPVADLPVCQGRVQSLTSLLNTLNKSQEIAEKMSRKSQ